MRILELLQDAFRRPSLLVSSSDDSRDQLGADLTRRISSSYFSPGTTIRHQPLPLSQTHHLPGKSGSLSLEVEHQGEDVDHKTHRLVSAVVVECDVQAWSRKTVLAPSLDERSIESVTSHRGIHSSDDARDQDGTAVDGQASTFRPRVKVPENLRRTRSFRILEALWTYCRLYYNQSFDEHRSEIAYTKEASRQCSCNATWSKLTCRFTIARGRWLWPHQPSS
jgi:hypothetical protein